MINLLGEETTWLRSHDHDPDIRALADRHYSRKKRGAYKYVGIGEYEALKTQDGKAAFIWRKSRDDLRLDSQIGVECTLFRNEAPEKYRSSDLIREAVEIARRRWGPGIRLFTYVNPTKIRSTYPGYCFISAGWTTLPERSIYQNLVILELLPEATA